MKLFIIMLPIIYAIKNSCHTCIWIRTKFPRSHQCIYFQIPIKYEHMNCSSHKLKNIDW